MLTQLDSVATWTQCYEEDSEARPEGKETDWAGSNTRVKEDHAKLEKTPNLTGKQVTRNTTVYTEWEKITPVLYTATVAFSQLSTNLDSLIFIVY